MNKIDKLKIKTQLITWQYFNLKRYNLNLVKCLLTATLFATILSCSTDDTQTVARFTELVMQDEFDMDGAPNSAIWDYDIGTGTNGWGNNDVTNIAYE